MKLHPISLFLLSVALLSHSGCAWLKNKEDETANWSASRFYSEAKDEMASGNFETAVRLFEKLQARYPFGRYAQQSQIEVIYAHYKDGETDSAIAAADRFIRTHPRHPFIDYVYYLKGLNSYSRGVGLIEKLLPGDPARTDTSNALQAYNDFAELIQKFPDSKYAKDAKQRMLFLRNNVALYEVHVGEYYLERKAYIAAANRGKYVLENYARTPAVEPALALMAEAYTLLGMQDLAQDSYRVLKINYAQSPYIARLDAVSNGQSPPREKKSLLAAIFDLF